MSYTRILITGATGFIGSRLCEKLSLQHHLPYRALVRNFAHAARIARLGAEMVAGDVGDQASLEAGLAGCDGVVHLAFGGARKAEESLVAARRAAAVKRLIHISSMAVHGPSPGPECAREATATIGRYNEAYSDAKAHAEQVVQKAMNEGLPGVILRPTVVYGPYSPFVTRVVDEASGGTISLIDQGAGICNAVYVDDVCDAIVATLHSDAALGKAMFVNADRAVTWREFNLTFANMVQPPPVVTNVSAQAARAHWAAMRPSLRSNLSATKRLMASGDFHDQLATIPALRSALTWTKTNLKKVLSADRVRSIKGETSGGASAVSQPAWPNPGRIVREDFHLEFSNELARSVMDWQPRYDFAAGAALTRTWLEFAQMLTAPS